VQVPVRKRYRLDQTRPVTSEPELPISKRDRVRIDPNRSGR